MEAPAAPEQLAGATATLLRSLGHRAGQAVLLALPSEWCLCAAIDVTDLPRKDRRQAMIFRLEEKLPIAAEEFTADFVEGKASAFGVAVRTELLRPVIDALESAGVPVAAVCPGALLVDFGTGADAYVGQFEASSLELLTRRDGELAGWYTLAATARDVRLHLGVLARALKREPVVRYELLDDALRGAVEGGRGAPRAEGDGLRGYRSAAVVARGILTGDEAPPLDLRRDALAASDGLRPYRTPLYAACAAAAVLLLSVSVVMLWRAHRYGLLAAASEARQRDLFTAAFPEQSPPAAIRSRLTSEETRLRALGGLSSSLPTETPTLLVLRDALAALPPRVRFRLLEIRVDSDRFQLDGQALSHTDADALANALRKNPRFRVDSPRSEQLAGGGGVSFTLAGSVSSAPPGRTPPGNANATNGRAQARLNAETED